MRFVPEAGVWHLVEDDHAGVLVLATLRTEIELLALKTFCTHFAADPLKVPEHFTVGQSGRQYRVTPLGADGEPLRIVIRADDGQVTTIETALVLRLTPS